MKTLEIAANLLEIAFYTAVIIYIVRRWKQ